jgi:hypothetical protein
VVAVTWFWVIGIACVIISLISSASTGVGGQVPDRGAGHGLFRVYRGGYSLPAPIVYTG